MHIIHASLTEKTLTLGEYVWTLTTLTPDAVLKITKNSKNKFRCNFFYVKEKTTETTLLSN